MLNLLKSKSGSNTYASLVIFNDILQIAAIKVTPAKAPQLVLLSEFKRDTTISLGQQINQLARSFALKNFTWNIILPPQQYQLLLVDVPDVPEEEINNTLKLKTMDLIQFPLEEACLSVFRLPDEAYRGRLKMAYIVAAKRNLIQSYKDEFCLQGLKLNSVDIAAMAFRNLGALHSQKESFAVLTLQSETSYITCCYQGYMCLNRQVDVGYDQLQSQEPSENELTLDNLQIHLNSMALEVQRSLDYFESQLRLGATPEILVIAPDVITSDVMTLMDNAFLAKVVRLRPDELINVMEDYDHNKFTENCLALGGALRHVGD